MNMKHALVKLSILPVAIWAHPGHPGPADHGDLTHFMLGTLLALPLLAGIWLTLRHMNQRKAARVVSNRRY